MDDCYYYYYYYTYKQKHTLQATMSLIYPSNMWGFQSPVSLKQRLTFALGDGETQNASA